MGRGPSAREPRIGDVLIGDRRPLSLVHRVRQPLIAPSRTERPPLLILLHGVGSNELSMASLAPGFDPRCIVISPRAPIQLEPYAFAWLHVTFTAQGPVIDREALATACGQMADFVEETASIYEADPARVFVAGFSQGGIMALGTLLTAPERVAGAVCMSGRLPPEIVPGIASPERLRDKVVLIVHGTHDQTLEVKYGRDAYEILGHAMAAVEYLEFDMTHTTNEESLGAVSAWLAARLGP